MSRYIHHVPGRLRVKSPGLKRNEAEAARTVAHMQHLHGVASAEVNTVTGSLLIRYDINLVAAQTLLNTLRGLGHVQPEPGHGVHYQGPGLGQKISDTVVNKLVETVLERSATALVAALF
ncbi:MAG: HMA2 domain-containing protein [Thiobacillaceae bacterium]